MAHQLWFNVLLPILNRPGVRVALLTLYYLAIIIGLIIMYGKGNFTTPSFIYQGF